MRTAHLFTLALLVGLPLVAAAQGGGSGNEFIPLLPSLPGIDTLQSGTSLAPFLSQVYKICIGLAAVLAVLQLMRAGVMYMGGDSITEKKEARELITLSIIGLLLVLSPVIVFTIINPKILQLDINASSLKTEIQFIQNPRGANGAAPAANTPAATPAASGNTPAASTPAATNSGGATPAASAAPSCPATITPGVTHVSSYTCCTAPLEGATHSVYDSSIGGSRQYITCDSTARYRYNIKFQVNTSSNSVMWVQSNTTLTSASACVSSLEAAKTRLGISGPAIQTLCSCGTPANQQSTCQ